MDSYPRKPDRKKPLQGREKKQGLLKAWAFRLAAFFLLPIVVLMTMEGMLRLVGFGRPTSYFIQESVNGEQRLIPNEVFSRTFFPGRTARSPNPVVFERNKKPGTFRIFVFGESAALGDPRPGFGMPRYLQVLLNNRFPETEFEVICTAMTAINSHVILPIARECADLDGDLWIVYMGNNEMVGPFGATGVLGSQAPPLFWIRSYVFASHLRLFQLVQLAWERASASSEHSQEWGGMQMFLERQVTPEDPKRNRVHRHFDQNLRDILRIAESRNTPVLLGTMASDLVSAGPFASAHTSGMSGAKQGSWQSNYDEGIALKNEQRFEAAIERFKQAASIDATYADLNYILGMSLAHTTNTEEAVFHLKLARDQDALPFRTDSESNRVISEIADDFRNVELIDSWQGLPAQGDLPLPGDTAFLDHVHFTPEGNYALALMFANRVYRLLIDRVPRVEEAWPAQEQCDAALGLTHWNRMSIYEEMLRRFSVPPFTARTGHPSTVVTLQNRIADLVTEINHTDSGFALQTFETALSEAPNDFRIRENYAEVLEKLRRPEEALKQWNKIREIIPFHFGPKYHSGRLNRLLGRWDEALPLLMQAHAVHPESPDIGLEIARALHGEGNLSEAVTMYEDLVAEFPRHAEIRLHFAETLAKVGQRGESIRQLEEAVRLRPTFWEALYLLGVEFAANDRIEEAARAFEKVVAIKPNHTLALFNLAMAHAKSMRFDDARNLLIKVLEFDPTHEQARQSLTIIDDIVSKR